MDNGTGAGKSHPHYGGISRLSGLSESICWGPLHGLINGYAKLAMHRYPRKQEQVERRMHCIYESCERLGLPLKRRVSRL